MSVSRFPIGARFSAIAVSLTLLGGCASVPDLGPRPSLRTADNIAATRSLPATAAAWPGDGWWTAYGDPQLDRLITEGLSGSPDVAAAAGRLLRAQGLAREAGAALLPRIDARGSVTEERQSLNNGFPANFKDFLPQGWNDHGMAALSFDFDLDLWGRNRAALAAATSEARAAQIDVAQARLMLATGIADAYADLARLYAERDIVQGALDIRSATRSLVENRVKSGLDTRGDQRQAEAGVLSARADLSAAEEAIALRRNQIAALVGAGPDRGLDIARPALAVFAPRGLPAGITTDLVGRRPDVAAARARAEAAASRIKQARAAFFPAISLSALIGVQSLGLDLLTKNDSIYGSVGPAISLPIFHGGALSGQYRGARGTYDEAVATYDRTVLDAYRQVADAVTSQKALDSRLGDARAALKASQDAYGIAQLRFRGGLSAYLDVLLIEERLLQARQAVAQLDTRAFALDIALIRALGGGFTASDALPKDRPNG
ncbi:efflux transporter outer membrane subunit [Sphingobium sp. AN558]|uniref:efflux transporter outer membrane subunit n=1 Tax=Sphingobium sp. AN558 TaxID=3133442 RepID=UPI0030BF3F60